MTVTSTPDDSASAIICALLVSLSVFGNASSSTWPVFDSRLPDDTTVPDESGAVFDTSGVKQPREQRGSNLFYFGFQVRVRGKGTITGKNDAWAQAKKVCDALEALVAWTNVTVGSHVYRIEGVQQVGSPLFLGIEPGTKRRVGYSCNFTVTLTQTS